MHLICCFPFTFSYFGETTFLQAFFWVHWHRWDNSSSLGGWHWCLHQDICRLATVILRPEVNLHSKFQGAVSRYFFSFALQNKGKDGHLSPNACIFSSKNYGSMQLCVQVLKPYKEIISCIHNCYYISLKQTTNLTKFVCSAKHLGTGQWIGASDSSTSGEVCRCNRRYSFSRDAVVAAPFQQSMS